jgi:hypothetical protein
VLSVSPTFYTGFESLNSVDGLWFTSKFNLITYLGREMESLETKMRRQLICEIFWILNKTIASGSFGGTHKIFEHTITTCYCILV